MVKSRKERGMADVVRREILDNVITTIENRTTVTKLWVEIQYFSDGTKKFVNREQVDAKRVGTGVYVRNFGVRRH
jgi:hypothetical protein